MGDGGLGESQQHGDVADAHLRLKQHVEDTDAGGIAEDAKQLRQVVEGVLAGHLLLHFFHDVLMGVNEVAALHGIAVFHTYLLIYE